MANSDAIQNAAESSSEIHDASQLKDSFSPNEVIPNFTELSFLQKSISTVGSAEEDMTEGDISALFKQLEAANGVAQGVESKLDKLLENLEGLLEGLEGGEAQPDQGAAEGGPGSSETTERHA